MNRIKRLVSFALAMVLVLSLTACVGKGSRAEGIYYDASGVCADAVLMSGSGPTVFGLVENEARVSRIYNGLRGFCEEVYVVRMLGERNPLA